MKIDYKRHLLYGLVISLVHLCLSWLFVFTFDLVIVWLALSPPIIIGGTLYGLKDVKGFLEGLVSGLIYVMIGFIAYTLYIYFFFVPNFSPFLSGFAGILGAACMGLLITAGIYGWINEKRE